MSDSTEAILEARAQKDASIRQALALYPDLYFDGDYLAARSLTPEDCDTIVVIESPKGDRLQAARQVGRVVVLQAFSYGSHASGLLRKLKESRPEAYAAILEELRK